MASEIFKFESVDDDDGPLVYYKLTLWAFGSGELKIVRNGMSLDHPRRKPWKLSSNFVMASVACCLSLTCIPLFTDYDHVLHVRSDKKMTQECQSV